MIRFPICLLIALPLSGFGQIGLFQWNDLQYGRFTTDSFLRLPVVNQLIDPAKVDYPLLNAAIFYRTNQERVRHGIVEFHHSSALENAASGHSKDMFTHDFFSHTSPVPGKESMGKRLAQEGVPIGVWAENIYYMMNDGLTYWSAADRMVSGWMKSQGHRENILERSVFYLGCGTWVTPDREWPGSLNIRATQNFSARATR